MYAECLTGKWICLLHYGTRQGYKLQGNSTLLSGSFVLLQLSVFYNQLKASTAYHTSAVYVYSYDLISSYLTSHVVYACAGGTLCVAYLSSIVCISHTLAVTVSRMVLSMCIYHIVPRKHPYLCMYVKVPLPARKVWKHAPRKIIRCLDTPLEANVKPNSH